MATLCMKNIEQTQKIQEKENREKTKKKTKQHINYKEKESEGKKGENH